MRAKSDGQDRLLLAALLLFVAGLCLQPIIESDLFFRLRVGQEILLRHGLLGRNFFSFTAPDYPDLDLSWAFEVIAALVYRLGGFPAVVAAKSLWLVATFAAAFALCRRRGAGPIASTLTLAAAAALVMRERLVERPHIVSFAGEVTVLWAVDTLGNRWSWSRALVLLLAMVAWVNLHAGIFVGVFICLLAAVGGWPSDRARAGRTGLLAGIVMLAAAINPVGPVGLVRYLILHITLPRIHAIDEFRAATWRSDAPFFVWVLLLGAVVWAARVINRRMKASAGPADVDRFRASLPAASDWISTGLLPACGMILLGMSSVRFSADATLVSAPLMAVGLSSVFTLLTRTDRDGRARKIIHFATPLTAAVLIAVTLGPRFADARAGKPAVDLNVDDSGLPLDALRFVELHGLRARMYNDFETGSYLLFQGFPRYRVFVDPRLPAYPEDMHRLLGAFDLDRATWDAAMTSYGVETALLGYAGVNRRVSWWDPAEWALVYRAHDTRVFVRRRDRWLGLIAAYEIPASFDFTVEHGTVTQPLEHRPERSPVAECDWQHRLGDLIFELDHGTAGRARAYYERALTPEGCLGRKDEANLSAWLGALELASPDAEHTLGHLTRALALSPDDTRTRASRASVLERLGRRSDAIEDWTRVAAEAGDGPVGQAAKARARRLSAAR